MRDLIQHAILKRWKDFGSLAPQAFRLFDSEGDGLKGLYLDRFKQFVVAHLHSSSVENNVNTSKTTELQIERLLRAEAASIANWAQVDSIYLYKHQRSQRKRVGGELIFGPAHEKVIISEHKVNYLLKPLENPSAGLFLDMRDVRADLLNIGANKRVLNLFCFTGSLGLAALLGGAKEVVQVDTSKKALSWAKENLELNSAQATGNMRFIPEDAVVLLKRELKRSKQSGSLYDVIIIDPPAFSSIGSQGAFKLEEQFEVLLSNSIALLAPQGQLIFCTNLRTLPAHKIEQRLRQLLAEHLKVAKSLRQIASPEPDFKDIHAMRGVAIELF